METIILILLLSSSYNFGAYGIPISELLLLLTIMIFLLKGKVNRIELLIFCILCILKIFPTTIGFLIGYTEQHLMVMLKFFLFGFIVLIFSNIQNLRSLTTSHNFNKKLFVVCILIFLFFNFHILNIVFLSDKYKTSMGIVNYPGSIIRDNHLFGFCYAVLVYSIVNLTNKLSLKWFIFIIGLLGLFIGSRSYTLITAITFIILFHYSFIKSNLFKILIPFITLSIFIYLLSSNIFDVMEFRSITFNKQDGSMWGRFEKFVKGLEYFSSSNWIYGNPQIETLYWDNTFIFFLVNFGFLGLMYLFYIMFKFIKMGLISPFILITSLFIAEFVIVSRGLIMLLILVPIVKYLNNQNNFNLLNLSKRTNYLK